MKTEPSIKLKPFLRNQSDKKLTLEFNKQDNRFLNSENLNKLESLNIKQVEIDDDTPDTLTNISIENTIQSSQNNKFGKK